MTIPSGIVERARRGGAVSLVGGDQAALDVLFGQFEHPEEAILRFDRKTGCPVSVVGPWPTLTRVVRGREGLDSRPRLSPERLLVEASQPELRAELAGIVAVYAARGNTGEDKLSFSLDGKSVMITATDERVLASADGGQRWAYVAPTKKLVDMPVVSPDGRFGVVRVCTGGQCGGPPSAARYESALVTFTDLSRAPALSGATLHDAIFTGPNGLVLTESDAYGKPRPSKICVRALDPAKPATVKEAGCVPSTLAGYWHMTSASPRRTVGVVSSVSGGSVRLSVRSLADGRELAVHAVPGDWEQYQWVSVFPNDAGHVALQRGRGPDPLGGDARGAERYTEILRPGQPPEIVKGARPLGWLSDRELVLLEVASARHERGCGLVRVHEPPRGP